MIILNKEVKGKNKIGLEVGIVTLDVPYHGVVTTEYYVYEENVICIAGFVGQYRTGAKLWSASIHLNELNNTFRFSFGRDNNNETQRNSISYNREAFLKDSKKFFSKFYQVA